MGSKSKSTNTSTTVYGNTRTTNPYAYAKTDNSGTVSGFQSGTAFNTIYDFVNKNAEALLNEYLNPQLDSASNQAKLKTFANTLSKQTEQNLENNIINPLSRRNMIRSSQANDLYKNLTKQNVSAAADFAANLISGSQTDTAKILGNLLSYYMLGANYLSSMQSQSLNTSQGNASRYSTTEQGSGGNLAADLAPVVIATLLTSAI